MAVANFKILYWQWSKCNEENGKIFSQDN